MSPGRPSATDRLQRLLALVPWVAAHDGPSIEEVCARFQLTPDRLVADLELVSMVGVHPFTPDELVDVVVEDGRVWAHYALAFRRPLRLTPEQALALVAAGRTVLAVPGADRTGPLARGLTKLAATLGIDPDEALEVDLGAVAPGTLALLESAIRDHRQVEMDYYAYGRDERTHRTVEPSRLYAAAGRWYLVANCHRAGGERVFRVDRIDRAEVLDATFDPPGDDAGFETFQAGPDDPRVTIELDRSARWVLDAYPVDAVEELDGGGCRVTLAVSARPWLERLLLRLGPAGRLTGNDAAAGALGDGGDLPGDAARRVLARYAQPSR